MHIQFLGVGNSIQIGLGYSAAVFSYRQHHLLIDCGHGITKSYLQIYHQLPRAIFITHTHLEHIADFETLFTNYQHKNPDNILPKLFVPAAIVPLLNQRIASFSNVLAEGGVNFWDVFQMIPVNGSFYWNELKFLVHEVRHHAPETAYGLQLPNCFFFTGDTRPIPEVLQAFSKKEELIFHDCAVHGNPSHTGLDDLDKEYPPELIKRMRFYHYESFDDIQHFEQKGLKVVKPLSVYEVGKII